MPMIRICCVSDHITACADDSYELYAMIHVHSVLPCTAVRDHIVASYDSQRCRSDPRRRCYLEDRMRESCREAWRALWIFPASFACVLWIGAICCMEVLSSLGAWSWAQPFPERSPSQRVVLQWLAGCLHMQLFAVVNAASEPELGIAHAVALSYVVVWAVARHTMLSHGARCRLDTSLCYALIAFLNVRPMAERSDAGGSLSTAGFIVSVPVVSVLPSWSLWWPPKRGAQEPILAQLEAFVRSNLAMLAQRHAERPPQGEGSLPCLLNTLRTKPVEQKRFYMFLQRMSQNAGALNAETQRRVDAIWGLVEGAVAPPPAAPAASSNDGPRAAADAAQPAALDPMVEEHEAGVPLWAGPSDAWADFAFDRVQLQEIVAWIRDNDGASPGCKCSSFKPAWSKAKTRCSRASGARPRDRLLPAGVRPLVALIDIVSSEWPLYAEKKAEA